MQKIRRSQVRVTKGIVGVKDGIKLITENG
jgi:hypothetical protein